MSVDRLGASMDGGLLHVWLLDDPSCHIAVGAQPQMKCQLGDGPVFCAYLERDGSGALLVDGCFISFGAG